MFTTIFRTCLLSVFALCAISYLQAATEAQTPETLVTALYKQHETQSPFVQDENRSLLDRFFTKPLADALWKDAKESQGEVGALGFDPLFDAQDTDITLFSVHQAKIQGDSASVTVTFSNFGKKVKIVFSLEAQGDSWRISDIRYAKGPSLSEILASAQ